MNKQTNGIYEKNISEIIVNYIINKLISLTISQSLKIKTEKGIPNNCFEYVKKNMNNILSSMYILYDKDESRLVNEADYNKNNKSFFKSDIENIKNQSNNIEEVNNNINDIIFSDKDFNDTNMFYKNYFYNSTYKGDNNWDLLDEPASVKLDRYSSTLINYKESRNNREGKYHMKHDGILEVDENEENITKNKINKSNYDNEKEISLNKRVSKKLIRIIKNNNDNNNNNNNIEQKQKIKDIANQFECFDLDPEENNENIEKDQITMLRQQFELGKKNKDNEKKIIHEEKQKLLINQKLEEENMKKYIGKKINKDHNGEIIFIKSINPQKFKQDFIFGRTKFKTININASREKSPKKKIEKNKNDEITNNQENETNSNNNNNNKVEYSPRKGGRNTSIRSLPKLGSTKRRLSVHGGDKNGEFMPIITSGSNFNLINMEVGVSIKEDEQFKTGGLDFFSKFKKFSLKAYDKKLREAEALNNYKKNIEIIEEPKTQTIDDTNNYTMGYSTTYGVNNFSSIHTESNNYINRNIINQKMNSTNSSMFTHYMRNAHKDKIQSTNSLNPFIHLTSGGPAPSLIHTMDMLSLVSNEEEKIHKKNRNIFRRNQKNLIKKGHKFVLDDINLFTKNLMTNKRNEFKLREKMNTVESRRNPEKPNIREIIQEIGVKGKIMRNRSKLLVPIKSNIIDNENFFKH